MAIDSVNLRIFGTLGAFLALLISTEAAAGVLRTKSEVLWLQQLEQDAIDSGISPSIVHDALDNFTPDKRVLRLDKKQPEGKISLESYLSRSVTPGRVRKGEEVLGLYQNELALIETRTGVPASVVVALLGIESSFGQNMGDFEVVNALATLVYEGRRADFFRKELFNALRVLERENMTSDQLVGSWAGAMGQCQFMPSTYLKFAVDEDQNGQRDIWNSELDAFASAANYLAAEGWQRGQPWELEVEANDVPLSLIGPNQTLSLEEWGQRGVTLLNGNPLPQGGLQASLIRPDGDGGASYLIFDNFRALLRWNKSTYFALSVSLLADQIR